MTATKKRERLTIDISTDEHRKIKAYAAIRGQTLREFILGSIKAQMERDEEEADLRLLTTKPTECLRELWDNDRDGAYDGL